MDLKSYHKFVLVFVSVTFYFFPAGFLCQTQTVDNLYTKCRPFKCANMSGIEYPFWDAATSTTNANRILTNPYRMPCSWFPHFDLDCRNAFPILNISQLLYRVINFDFNKHTITVQRQHLWNNPCRAILAVTNQTSPSFLPFKIHPSYNHTILTLYYNCTGDRTNTTMRYHNFTCSGTGTTIILREGDNSTDHFTSICTRQITVPVNESAARALETSAASLLDALHATLADGFLIQWEADGDISNKDRPITYDRKEPLPQDASSPNDRNPKTVNHTQNSPAERNHRASNRTRLKSGVAFGGIGCILVFILISWLCKKQHCTSGPTNPPNIEKFIRQQKSLATQRYRYSEIKKIAKSFCDKLGEGGYGSVYKGMLANGAPVAVKLLFETDSNDEEFINEVASISRTSHVNIVSLLGFCYERNKRALIYEFMPNKSLDKFIRDADTSQDVGKLYNISIGVAKGLEYLHKGCNSRIVHFDIKPQNILLDENFCPKISDFGLAKLCKKKHSILSVDGMRGTIGYIAPEVFSRYFGGVSDKSDVYSYGIMLLEMAGAKKFVETEAIQSSEYYFADKIYKHVLTGHIRNVDYDTSVIKQEDDERVRKMLLVGFWCMQTIPTDRPSITKALEMLEGTIESIPIPPKPFLFNPEQNGQGFLTLVTTETTMTNSTEEDTLLECKC